MKLVKPKNRSCAPGWCWGLITPLSVVFTWIIVYAMLPNSLARELSGNKKALERIKHLKHLGLAYALSTVGFFGIILGAFLILATLDLFTGVAIFVLWIISAVAIFVLWIIYWVKLVKIRKTYLHPVI